MTGQISAPNQLRTGSEPGTNQLA